MTEIANTQQADIIVAPFLTKTVPEDVYNNLDVPCIIVHPGIEGDRGRHSLDWALKHKQSEWGVTLLQAAEEMDAGLFLNVFCYKLVVEMGLRLKCRILLIISFQGSGRSHR